MTNHNVNPSVKCSVSSCTHHCHDKDYCSLSEIRVGCCSSCATNSASTECNSFELDGNGCR